MQTNPTALYRLRDGQSTTGLLIVAVADVDMYSWLATRGGADDAATIAIKLSLAGRSST